MIPVAASTPHTDAVVDALQADELLVGRGVAPEAGGWQGEPGRASYKAFCVVFPSPGTPDGGTAEPLEYLDYKAQISCWGATAAQAERMADQVRASLIGRRLVVADRSCYRVQQPPGSNPPVRRDDTVSPAEYLAVVEIEFRSQPA